MLWAIRSTAECCLAIIVLESAMWCNLTPDLFQKTEFSLSLMYLWYANLGCIAYRLGCSSILVCLHVLRWGQAFNVYVIQNSNQHQHMRSTTKRDGYLMKLLNRRVEPS